VQETGEESPGSAEQDALRNEGVAPGDTESATENILLRKDLLQWR